LTNSFQVQGGKKCSFQNKTGSEPVSSRKYEFATLSPVTHLPHTPPTSSWLIFERI